MFWIVIALLTRVRIKYKDIFRAGFSRKLVSGEAVDDVMFKLLLMDKKLLISAVPIQYIFLQDTTGITFIYSKIFTVHPGTVFTS